jgi:HNH endonuclease
MATMSYAKGKELSEAFNLNVEQSLYSDRGNFYGLIKHYPCALWDRSGYIIFNNETELQIPGISVKKRININANISSLNGYKRVIYDFQLPEELPDGLKYQEGAVQEIKVNRFERDKNARNKCLSHYGCVCQICRMKLTDVYGIAAENLIHVHHIIPISEVGEAYIVDPIADLIPVCPNCHAVIHSRNPPYLPNAVSAMLKDIKVSSL